MSRRKRGRFISWQKTSTKFCNPCGENSPYWSWVDSSAMQEPFRANPDQISDEDQTDRLKSEEHRKELVEAVQSVKFSKREIQVLTLFKQADMTEEKVANILGVGRTTIQKYLQRIRKKCLKLLSSKVS